MQDSILLCQAHTRHHEDLFLNFLSRLTEAEKESSATTEDNLERELSGTYSRWADETIMVLGFVAAYHLWERQITEVLVQQFARREKKPPPKNPVNRLLPTYERYFNRNSELSVQMTCGLKSIEAA